MSSQVWVDYDLLITASQLVFNLTVLLLIAAYNILKRRTPDKAWMYGHNVYHAALISVLPGIGSMAMAVLAIKDDQTLFGVPHINLVSFAVIVAIGICMHAFVRHGTQQLHLAQVVHVPDAMPLIQHRT